MEDSRQQLQSYKVNQGPRPVLEEFIPLKHSSAECSEKAATMSDKANWMTSAQLWSQASDGTKQQSPINTSPRKTEIGFCTVGTNLVLNNNKQRNGGAFLPFSKDQNSSLSPALQALPDLALASINKEMGEKKCLEVDNGITCSSRENPGKVGQVQAGSSVPADPSQTPAATNATGATTTQTHRKARRCWSPDLHRRFVHALQMLGGSQGNQPKYTDNEP